VSVSTLGKKWNHTPQNPLSLLPGPRIHLPGLPGEEQCPLALPMVTFPSQQRAASSVERSRRLLHSGRQGDFSEQPEAPVQLGCMDTKEQVGRWCPIKVLPPHASRPRTCTPGLNLRCWPMMSCQGWCGKAKETRSRSRPQLAMVPLLLWGPSGSTGGSWAYSLCSGKASHQQLAR
jgi:hypothetical protein